MFGKIIGCILAYLIGGIPFGYIVVKLKRGVDIRNYGSGNIGATNVGRVLGFKWGLFVFILDFLKGFLPALLGRFIYGLDIGLLFGIFAIIGHILTPYLGGKGGKGVATSVGVFSAIVPIIALLSFILWGILLVIFKIVSLSSIVASIFAGMLVVIYGKTLFLKIVGFLIPIVIILTHRENIKRLLRKEERKIKI